MSITTDIRSTIEQLKAAMERQPSAGSPEEAAALVIAGRLSRYLFAAEQAGPAFDDDDGATEHHEHRVAAQFVLREADLLTRRAFKDHSLSGYSKLAENVGDLGLKTRLLCTQPEALPRPRPAVKDGTVREALNAAKQALSLEPHALELKALIEEADNHLSLAYLRHRCGDPIPLSVLASASHLGRQMLTHPSPRVLSDLADLAAAENGERLLSADPLGDWLWGPVLRPEDVSDQLAQLVAMKQKAARQNEAVAQRVAVMILVRTVLRRRPRAMLGADDSAPTHHGVSADAPGSSSEAEIELIAFINACQQGLLDGPKVSSDLEERFEPHSLLETIPLSHETHRKTRAFCGFPSGIATIVVTGADRLDVRQSDAAVEPERIDDADVIRAPWGASPTSPLELDIHSSDQRWTITVKSP